MFPLSSTVNVRPVTDQHLRRFVSLSLAAMVSIIAVGLTCLLGIIAGHFYAGYLSQFPTDALVEELELEWTMMFTAFVGLAQLALWIVAATCFILWFRRAYGFLDELSIASREHSLSWTGWGFVVPVLSLWRPYAIMREIWDAFTELRSQRPEIGARHKMPRRVIGLWWGFFLAQSFASNISFRLNVRSTTVADALNAVGMDDIASLMTMLAVVPAVLVVHQTTRLVEPALRIGSVPPVPNPLETPLASDLTEAAPPTS
ncbi:MAG: DUF4328 domain-containing protein [Bryobacterales bacterium]|jgi:hypothetical protein|nr:DUF4328 domain-containing protein [Bryobacterales bacterium]